MYVFMSTRKAIDNIRRAAIKLHTLAQRYIFMLNYLNISSEIQLRSFANNFFPDGTTLSTHIAHVCMFASWTVHFRRG